MQTESEWINFSRFALRCVVVHHDMCVCSYSFYFILNLMWNWHRVSVMETTHETWQWRILRFTSDLFLGNEWKLIYVRFLAYFKLVHNIFYGLFTVKTGVKNIFIYHFFFAYYTRYYLNQIFFGSVWSWCV